MNIFLMQVSDPLKTDFGGYHEVLQSKFAVPFFKFNAAKIVPAQNMPFHRGLLIMMNAPWLVLFYTSTEVVAIAKLVVRLD